MPTPWPRGPALPVWSGDMDLRQLRYFSVIAKHSSFRRAADELRLAQPALSQQMHRLEAELGVELFDRSTRPIRITPAGSRLLARSLSILEAIDDTADEMRELATKHRSRLTVGVMQYLTSLEVPDLLADFSRRHPLVDLGLRVGGPEHLCAGLSDGDIDIAMCHDDEISVRLPLEREHLRTEEFVVIVPHQDPRATDGSIAIQSLAEAPLIAFKHGAANRVFSDAFARAGLTPDIAFEGPDMSTVIGLVARGLGAALVARPIAEREPQVAWLRVAPEPLTREVALFWRSGGRRNDNNIDAFRQSAHRYAHGTPAAAVPDPDLDVLADDLTVS